MTRIRIEMSADQYVALCDILKYCKDEMPDIQRFPNYAELTNLYNYAQKGIKVERIEDEFLISEKDAQDILKQFPNGIPPGNIKVL